MLSSYLVSMLIANLLSLHLVTFFILVIIIIIEITHQTRCIHVDLQKHLTIINVNYRVQAWHKSVSSSQGRNPGTKTELFNSLIKREVATS